MSLQLGNILLSCFAIINNNLYDGKSTKISLIASDVNESILGEGFIDIKYIKSMKMSSIIDVFNEEFSNSMITYNNNVMFISPYESEEVAICDKIKSAIDNNLFHDTLIFKFFYEDKLSFNKESNINIIITNLPKTNEKSLFEFISKTLSLDFVAIDGGLSYIT
jgi:hypothetical protein